MNREKFKSELCKYINSSGEFIFDYFKCRTDWCAGFVSYAMCEIAKIPFKKTLSCSEMKRNLADRVNHDYKTAEIGDIILFENNGNPSDSSDHVGIVIGNSNGKIVTIEGNTNGSKMRIWYESSSVGMFSYSYNEPTFDCIIDMSEYFDDIDDKKEILDRIHELLDEVKILLDKIG